MTAGRASARRRRQGAATDAVIIEGKHHAAGRPATTGIDSPPNARGSTMSDKLLNDIDTVAPENLDDLFLIMAKNVEEGLIRGGARPGIDYSILDLYQLAQPFALAIFQKNIETMTYTVRW
jgi:hypothetical protein